MKRLFVLIALTMAFAAIVAPMAFAAPAAIEVGTIPSPGETFAPSAQPAAIILAAASDKDLETLYEVAKICLIGMTLGLVILFALVVVGLANYALKGLKPQLAQAVPNARNGPRRRRVDQAGAVNRKPRTKPSKAPESPTA